MSGAGKGDKYRPVNKKKFDKNFDKIKFPKKREGEMELIRYKLSKDGKGLLGYFEDNTFYHIHSTELTKLERWIKKLLEERK